MEFSAGLTPLEALESLTAFSRQRLREHYVNSVEELSGLMSADREGARELLELDASELDDLQTRATALLSTDLRQAMAEQRGRVYHGGALDPRTRGDG